MALNAQSYKVAFFFFYFFSKSQVKKNLILRRKKKSCGSCIQFNSEWAGVGPHAALQSLATSGTAHTSKDGIFRFQYITETNFYSPLLYLCIKIMFKKIVALTKSNFLINCEQPCPTHPRPSPPTSTAGFGDTMCCYFSLLLATEFRRHQFHSHVADGSAKYLGSAEQRNAKKHVCAWKSVNAFTPSLLTVLVYGR